DTISRQAAIDALDFEIVHMTAYCDGKNEGNPLAQYNKGLEDGKKAIEALPSAQPERKTGHWIEINNGLDTTCECSACHYKDYIDNNRTDLKCYNRYWFQRNFCPNCGAKMENNNDG
ncbi:MAG: hypothetical protein Q4A32_03500, partial [Lachnospiraceae bacterium]|nr:hypothetical protein [Lachnospiraceae bacterium]